MSHYMEIPFECGECHDDLHEYISDTLKVITVLGLCMCCPKFHRILIMDMIVDWQMETFFIFTLQFLKYSIFLNYVAPLVP